MKQKKKIAVVGAGVSGIVSAYILSRSHDVTLFEARDRLGGHTNTVVIEKGADKGAQIDTGFIVLNNKNYPLLHKFLAQLNVPVRWSNMSFGYHSDENGFEYSGNNLNTLFCDRLNIFRPKFYSFIYELYKFSNKSLKDLEESKLEGLTLGEYLKKIGSKDIFIKHYLIPMAAAIWSAPDKTILDFPAEMFIKFFKHHGLLSLDDRPRWQTVTKGSHSYVKKFKESFKGNIELSKSITSVKKQGNKVELTIGNKEKHTFDSVVLANHADQSRNILSDDDFPKLSSLLKNWAYQNNHTVLHTDKSILPSNQRCWSSWNYRRVEKNDSSPVFVSYYMNLLQGLSLENEYIVTLNSPLEIDKDKIIKEFNYKHPVFNLNVLDTGSKLKEVNGENEVYLCGSYTANGFHEDAVRSAVNIGKLFDLEL